MTVPRPAIALLVLLVLTAATGCRPPEHRRRVVVLGLDGLDPDAVDLLMSEGSMPNFARLRREGAYGRLRSEPPILSPIIWTTIATGKPPSEHGIGHFVAVNEKSGEQIPVTSAMRKVKALWTIASEAGRRVAVVGWWATWPAEAVQGAIVSDHTCYHFLFPAGATGGTATPGVVHPPELTAEIEKLVRRPSDVGADELAPFVRVTPEELARPFAFADPISHLRWALATGTSYRTIGLRLWESQHPDLLMVYVEGTDSVSHLFGHLFRARGLAGELAEQQARYGGAVEAVYRWADGIVGAYLDAIDADTTLVVLSDHGFALGALPDDPSATRDMRRVSERFHRLDGILYLYGSGVRARARIDGAHLVDVAPTVLALLGLPAAGDMPGRVLEDALKGVPLESRVASYERPHASDGTPAVADTAADPAIVERLRALGYIDDTRSPRGDRVLAGLAFQEKRYAEAAEQYAALVREHPEDAELQASLGGALGAVGRYDEALEHLDAAIRLQPLNVAAYHNRGVVREKQGERDAAVTDYRTALRYDPSYEPSQVALRRLVGTDETRAARTPSEVEGAKLAAQASDAARRGDYPAAMRLLDEAERVAPALPLVQQYRANVAFLQGDRTAARAALQRALELEPDNALFRTNLRALDEAGVAPPAGRPTGSPLPAPSAP